MHSLKGIEVLFQQPRYTTDALDWIVKLFHDGGPFYIETSPLIKDLRHEGVN